MNNFFSWKKYISLFLGSLIVAYFVLVNSSRSFLPRRAEDFDVFFLLSLCLFFLLLFLWTVKAYFYPQGGKFLLLWSKVKGVQEVLLLWKNSPKEVYFFLQKHLPSFPSLRNILEIFIEKCSRGELYGPWHFRLYTFFFAIPYLFPPLLLGLEFYFFSGVHYFYYSLLLLWLPIFYSLILFILQDYSLRQRRYLETFFSVKREGSNIRFSFFPEHIHDSSKVNLWYIHLRFSSQLYSLERNQSQYSGLLLMLRSLFYLLGWTQVLLAHPHGLSLLSFLPNLFP